MHAIHEVSQEESDYCRLSLSIKLDTLLVSNNAPLPIVLAIKKSMTEKSILLKN